MDRHVVGPLQQLIEGNERHVALHRRPARPIDCTPAPSSPGHGPDARPFPIAPKPTTPIVFPPTSSPSISQSHFSARTIRSARTRSRPSAMMSPMVNSATAPALLPGVFVTAMPRRVAAATSTLSKPRPWTATMRRRAASARTRSVTACRPTTDASASRSSAIRSTLVRHVLPMSDGATVALEVGDRSLGVAPEHQRADDDLEPLVSARRHSLSMGTPGPAAVAGRQKV